MSVTRTISAPLWNQKGVEIFEFEAEALFEVDDLTSDVIVSEIFVVWDGKRITLNAGDPGYEGAKNKAEHLLNPNTKDRHGLSTLASIEQELFDEARENDFRGSDITSGTSAWLHNYAAE